MPYEMPSGEVPLPVASESNVATSGGCVPRTSAMTFSSVEP